MEDKTKVDGMVIHLFKRQLFQNASDQESYDYMLFGFYDGMRFSYPKYWSQFGPEGIDNLLRLENKEQLLKRDCFSGVYSLKLLFPRESFCTEMINNYGFNYDIWKKNTTKRQPLFAALLLKATKKFVRYTNTCEKREHEKSRISCVAENIRDAMKQAGLSPKNIATLNCGLFQCLGYYDYALLFQSDDWGKIYKIADELKQFNINILDSENEPIRFIASDYLLLGMNSEEKSYEKISNQSDFQMSVEIKINPGYSFGQFQKVFIEKLADRDGENAPSKTFWQNHAHFYQFNGNADCVIVTDEKCFGITYVLREFDKGGLLTPGDSSNDFFNTYITSIHTSVLNPIYMSSNIFCIKTDSTDLLSLSQIGNKFVKWTNNMRTYWENDSAFIRRVHGIEDLIAQGKNLLEGKECIFDVERIMIPAYDMLITTLDELKILYEKEKEKEEEEKQLVPKSKGFCRKWKARTYQFLSDFRMYIGEFQDSLQFSDRNFIESIRIKHSSIGTSTKLILVYNELLNRFVSEMDIALKDFAAQLQKNENDIHDNTWDNSSDFKWIDWPNSRIKQSLSNLYQTDRAKKLKPFTWIDSSKKFLFTCGGQDRAEVINLSEDIPNTNIGSDNNCQIQDSLVVMRLSERSIFDIRGTLFRILHETWHLCGHRKRTDRCMLVVLDAAQRFSVVITNVMLHQRMIMQIVEYNNNSLTDDPNDLLFVKTKVQNIVEDATSKLAEDINYAILKHIGYQLDETISEQRKNNGNKIKDFFYKKNIVNILTDITVDVFIKISYGNQDKADLWQEIYDAYGRTLLKMYKTIEAVLSEKNMKTEFISDIIWKWQIGSHDKLLEDNIKELLNFLASGMVSVSSSDRASNGIEWRKWFQNFNVDKVYDFLLEVYSETFCDYMTCNTIGRQQYFRKEDYIMFFVYSNDDVDMELANTELNILRIGTILELFFQCDIRKELYLDQDYLRRLYIQSFCEDDVENKVNAIEQQASKIWKDYQTDRKYVKNLHKYLKVVYQYNAMDKIEDTVDIVKNIRRIFNAAEKLDSHEDVMNMVKELMTVWASMSENNRE